VCLSGSKAGDGADYLFISTRSMSEATAWGQGEVADEDPRQERAGIDHLICLIEDRSPNSRAVLVAWGKGDLRLIQYPVLDPYRLSQ
jgi:hypothetical protein